MVQMNLYDKKIVRCIKCDDPVGEIELGTKIVYSICESCENNGENKKNSKLDDKISYDYLNKRMIDTVSFP